MIYFCITTVTHPGNLSPVSSVTSRLKRRGGLMQGGPLKTPGIGVSRRSSTAWQRSSRKHVIPASSCTSSVRSMLAASSVSGPIQTRASPTSSMRAATSQEPEWWCELHTFFIFVISLLSINCHSTYYIVMTCIIIMYCKCVTAMMFIFYPAQCIR